MISESKKLNEEINNSKQRIKELEDMINKINEKNKNLYD